MATGPRKPSGVFPAAGSLYALGVEVVGGAEVRHVVRAELLQEGLGEDDGDHGFPDHGCRRHRAGVGSLFEGPRELAGQEVDGAQGFGYGRDRLHRRRDDYGLAVGHPTLEAAEVVASTRGVLVGFARQDLVLYLAGTASGEIEAHPELDALYGVYGQHGSGEPSV